MQIDYSNNSNYLKASTKYFEAALYIYVVAIGLSLLCKLMVQCMPQYYILTDIRFVNELLAGFALLPYFIYSIRVIYELKSIVGNTLLLFRTSLQFRILAFLGNENNSCDQGEQEENSSSV